jgi:hypothetical protein
MKRSRGPVGSRGLHGVLGRDIRVRVVEVSHSGCLLETAAPVEEGLSGSLQVVVEGEAYREQVRVARCESPGHAGGSYRLGTQFLWVGRPNGHSLRGLLGAAGTLLPRRRRRRQPP